MNLRNIAAHRVTERMEGWDPVTQDFVPDAFVGRITLTDRFLSNFNKPLRRRMLFTRHGEQLPESRVFRHPGTRDVYLIGQARSDALDGNPYLTLVVCHLVTEEPGGSSGHATLFRKVPQGPADNPGWLVEVEVAKTFADLEFRTSANEPEMHDVRVENFFAFLPSTVVAEPGDRLYMQGRDYRVVDTFADSGFAGLRVDKEPDTRVNFVVHRNGGRVYDKATHSYTNARESFNVTGTLLRLRDFASWSDESQPYVDVTIDQRHIGFRPEPGLCEVEIEGRRRVAKSVQTQHGERQYLLRCY